eukprot:scaffold3944_cov361-Prasinococcus_capsulatus_cf.AAC.7
MSKRPRDDDDEELDEEEEELEEEEEEEEEPDEEEGDDDDEGAGKDEEGDQDDDDDDDDDDDEGGDAGLGEEEEEEEDPEEEEPEEDPEEEEAEEEEEEEEDDDDDDEDFEEEDDDLEDQETVNVNFEFHSPAEVDYKGVKALMTNYLSEETMELSKLCDKIISQRTVGLDGLRLLNSSRNTPASVVAASCRIPPHAYTTIKKRQREGGRERAPLPARCADLVKSSPAPRFESKQ